MISTVPSECSVHVLSTGFCPEEGTCVQFGPTPPHLEKCPLSQQTKVGILTICRYFISVLTFFHHTLVDLLVNAYILPSEDEEFTPVEFRRRWNQETKKVLTIRMSYNFKRRDSNQVSEVQL